MASGYLEVKDAQIEQSLCQLTASTKCKADKNTILRLLFIDIYCIALRRRTKLRLLIILYRELTSLVHSYLFQRIFNGIFLKWEQNKTRQENRTKICKQHLKFSNLSRIMIFIIWARTNVTWAQSEDYCNQALHTQPIYVNLSQSITSQSCFNGYADCSDGRDSSHAQDRTYASKCWRYDLCALP